ncbi:single-stranded-DNA-specific exonuclease RecJ [Phormidium sp. CCY1219]|uniref:single-stranded-DNA-specific exonuclease RecJ n=1 Tax=Phormidium sp. CCY1219 TaxID=2886104 RepID=UPI002D1F60FC|nr:single-stranded-DNA-specific exonuclease RecJ [Phormidium sp. CCY1219]MEB3825887.1 single-stranded-DNA-specific exonuclease RecJ [Phormidium sp. CCY1219]
MGEAQTEWRIEQPVQPPEWFLEEVRRHAPGLSGNYAAMLLWQRGIRDRQELVQFLNPQTFQPTSPFEFQEMHWAVQRLAQARARGEKVAIWGDFDADGVTATSVLWDGLGQFFDRHTHLTYFIPNRLTQSHGLNHGGIDQLASSGTRLIVTCDTGSTNLEEIEYARELGIETIVTDHHTLPTMRPPVVAIVNPRHFPENHPLATLSGVAVAYKLVEALYQIMPEVPQEPLGALLDLVAIGLIADLVELRGESRYLAQVGIDRLHREFKKPATDRRRPGVGELLDLCKRHGDRPTDISFGIGPRINAVSRIHGDASFCVELLTTRDRRRAQKLALDTDLANTRRKSVQKDVAKQVSQKLEDLDLSTTRVIVLDDPQWPAGVLGLVAGQVAQECALPTILLTTEDSVKTQENVNSPLLDPQALARGSARSVNGIDLYELVKEQAHLLHRFGGHPLAAGLSLPVENIPLFTEAINRHLREQRWRNGDLGVQVVQADLVCKVAQLGKPLFQELKLLEPCGMGNPVPRIFIENCRFQHVWHRNIKDFKGGKVQYIKTEFEIVDDSTGRGFPGVWWGHYKDELPSDECDAIVELDSNSYNRRYEVRLIAVRRAAGSVAVSGECPLEIVDWRGEELWVGEERVGGDEVDAAIVLSECPRSWEEFHQWFGLAMESGKTLAIAYSPPPPLAPLQIWQQLVGVAKYLSRTGQVATRQQLREKVGVSDRTLGLGLQTLEHLGFQITAIADGVQCVATDDGGDDRELSLYPSGEIAQFFAAVREEQFRREYFYSVPLSTLRAIAYSEIRDRAS